MADSKNLMYNAEVKRDSFGFTVRPQHLQRYREYGHIYKEEEDERVDKWRNFLEQCVGLVQSSAGDQCGTSTIEATEEKTESTLDSSKQGNDSSEASWTTNSQTQGEAKREIPVSKEEKRRRIKTYDPIRFSLAPIENMLSVRIEEKILMKKHREPTPQKHLPLTAEENSEGEDSGENIEGQLFSDELVGVPSKETETAHASSNDNKMSDKCCHKNEASNIPCQEDEINGDLSHEDVDSHSYSNKEAATVGDEAKDQEVENDVVSSRPDFPWKEELESLVHGGVPKCLRGEVWQAFVGVPTRRVETYYQDLLSPLVDVEDSSGQASREGSMGVNSGVPEKLKKQIEKDLPRTFPGHPALDEEGRNSLRRILTAYARHNPSVGYCQAMNFFAGLLLLLMPEENAFWTLVGLIDDYFEGYYTQEMIESQVDQLVFEDLMRERFPKLVNHLDYLGVEVAWLSGPWFLSIFANILPWESVLRVWDVMLFEGNRVMLFRTALALMELYGPAIVTTKDAGDAVTLLQSLAGSTFDSSQLVLTACMGFLAITEAKLQELRNKHRPSVLGILEERARGTQVSKESKGLATKLYSFKHGPQSLGKETNTAERKKSQAKLSADNIGCMNIDPEAEVGPDLQEQVVWLKVELCRLLEEKRQATLRAEELETAFIEMVKQDNRRQLSARVEQLEREVVQLRQAVADKQEQEQAMLQVLMRVEQEQRVAEDARIAAEQDAAVQRYTVQVLQEKYEKAMASLAEKEKRVKVAESMLEATLQYESGQSKALASPRLPRPESPPKIPIPRKTGLLSFGLGWREKNKGNANNVDEPAESQQDREAQLGKPTGNVE